MSAETWVAVAFFAFCGILLYVRVPALVTAALDKRSDEIKSELDEARRLKEEAQALLAEYQRKRSEADQEAEDIIARAKREAETLAVETRAAMKEMLVRRTRLAEEKIARAEEQAASDVRAAAVSAAIAAAEQMIRQKADGDTSANLIDAGISEIKTRLAP